MELSFRYRFEAAHRFTDASSKCATPHGHSWWVTLCLSHESSDINLDKNFAVDFSDLKKEWRKFVDEELDHYFFLNSKDPILQSLKTLGHQLRIKETPGDPTTEVLSCLFFKKAESLFKESEVIRVESILLEETPTNSVRVLKEDADQFLERMKSLPQQIWWA